MTDTITIGWGLEDAEGRTVEIGEKTNIRANDAADAFADIELKDLSDQEIEEYILDCINTDFQEKIGAEVDTDALAAAVASLRAALEKARTT